MTYRQSLREALRLDGTVLFDLALVERLLDTIDLILRPLEAKTADYDAAIRQLAQVALDRINNVLTPAIISVQKVQEKGYLLARSDSAVTINLNDVVTLTVEDPDERALFQPSPFVFLSRRANNDDFAIGRRIDWSPLGELTVEIVATWGATGPHNDWVLMAHAGIPAAIMAMLDDARAIADAIDTLKTDAVNAAGAAEDAADASFAFRNEALGFRNQGETFRDQAQEAAEAAQTFDPAAYILGGPGAAARVAFDNAGNGFVAAHVQAAIEELIVKLGAVPVGVQLLTTSGLYTRSPGVTRALIIAVGGGQAGGGINAATGGYPGGSSGEVRLAVIAPDATENVTIAAGGVGSTSSSGPSGGDTIFGAFLTAKGGGGTAGSGGVLLAKNAGGSGGSSGATAFAGSGGNTALGFGAGGKPRLGSNGPGLAASGFGAGGGGAGSGTSATYNGGNGGAGCILVLEFK